MNDKKQKALLFLAFGGADSLANVEPFLNNVLSPRTPSPELLEQAKSRYARIGGSSPLLDITKAQAVDTKEALLLDGDIEDLKIYVGMRNWDPLIADTVKQMKEDGVEEAVALIMAPYTSPAATGGYNTAVEEAIEKVGGGISIEIIDSFDLNLNYYAAVIENMHTALTGFMDIKDKTKLRIVFSAHSLPLKMLENDPYIEKIQETIDYINSAFDNLEYRLAFQSKGGGPIEWAGPSVEEVLEEAKEDGMRGVMLSPLGFVSDHVETLYDIDILFKEKAIELGLTFVRAPSLNTSEKFIQALAETIKPHLY